MFPFYFLSLSLLLCVLLNVRADKHRSTFCFSLMIQIDHVIDHIRIIRHCIFVHLPRCHFILFAVARKSTVFFLSLSLSFAFFLFADVCGAFSLVQLLSNVVTMINSLFSLFFVYILFCFRFFCPANYDGWADRCLYVFHLKLFTSVFHSAFFSILFDKHESLILT